MGVIRDRGCQFAEDSALVTQSEIARQVGLDVSSVCKILNSRNHSRFGRQTIQRVFKVARRLKYDFHRLKHVHQRRHHRVSVDLVAELLVYLRKDGTLYDRGHCSICDLSLVGACISGVALPRRALPLESYSFIIRPKCKEMKDVEIRAFCVRSFFRDGLACVGVEFEKGTPSITQKLQKMLCRVNHQEVSEGSQGGNGLTKDERIEARSARRSSVSDDSRTIQRSKEEGVEILCIRTIRNVK